MHEPSKKLFITEKPGYYYYTNQFFQSDEPPLGLVETNLEDASVITLVCVEPYWKECEQG